MGSGWRRVRVRDRHLAGSGDQQPYYLVVLWRPARGKADTRWINLAVSLLQNLRSQLELMLRGRSKLGNKSGLAGGYVVKPDVARLPLSASVDSAAQKTRRRDCKCGVSDKAESAAEVVAGSRPWSRVRKNGKSQREAPGAGKVVCRLTRGRAARCNAVMCLWQQREGETGGRRQGIVELGCPFKWQAASWRLHLAPLPAFLQLLQKKVSSFSLSDQQVLEFAAGVPQPL